MLFFKNLRNTKYVGIFVLVGYWFLGRKFAIEKKTAR